MISAPRANPRGGRTVAEFDGRLYLVDLNGGVYRLDES